MRTFRNILLITAFSLISSYAFGQAGITDNPKYGADSASRFVNAQMNSVYKEFYKQSNFKDAFEPWNHVYKNAPKLSQNTYIWGTKIMAWKVESIKDKAIQEKYIDSLMMIYDNRVKYYPSSKYKVLDRKALELLKYRPENIEEAYGFINEAIEAGKNKSTDIAIYYKMKLAVILFKQGKKDAEEVLNAYTLMSEYADYNIANSPKDAKDYQEAKNNIDKEFGESGAASCENLIALFTPKFKATPNDLELLKKISTLLGDNKCTDSKLFADASENLYKIEPSAMAAYRLAQVFVKKTSNDKAKEYYLKALNLETDNSQKANILIELSSLLNTNMGLQQEAIKYAKQAISADPKNGKTYLITGIIYSSIKDYGSTELTKRSIYWIAVDYFTKAKSVDPSLAAEMNEKINIYNKHFPAGDVLFFYDLTEGQEYKTEGWISETTTVRASK